MTAGYFMVMFVPVKTGGEVTSGKMPVNASKCRWRWRI